MKFHLNNLKILLFGLSMLFVVACSSPDPADIVLRGGKVLTVDGDFSTAEAVAVMGDKIVFVGSSADVEGYVGANTEVIELDGKLLIPGLIDSHGHVGNQGAFLDNLDFFGTTSYTQIIDIIKERADELQPGEWILGRGWDQNDWDVKEFPVHDALSRAVPNNPVVVTRVDGHAILANAKAMEAAGVTRSTQSPDGGKIHQKRTGTPSGVFVDNAMGLIRAVIPELSTERRRDQLLKAGASGVSVGLTGTHDAGISPTTASDYKYLIDNSNYPMRVYAMYRTNEADLVKFFNDNRIIGYGGNMLTARSMKISIDGALGSRGAAMIEDYTDDKGNKGLLITPYERVLQAAKAALETGFQLNVHAIGDRGNRLVLDAYEIALKENPNPDHRFRIEHSQIVTLEDIPRFKELGVIPAMQATHATSDMYWAEDRVGPQRIIGAYAWRKFLNDGHHIANGSDYPVENNNPMLGFYASITRQDAKSSPEGGWYPDQKMTREETLKSWTIWGAEAAFQEDILGSIEVGKLADLVVMDKDIMTIEPTEILTAKPLYTIVNGKIRYRSNR